MLSDTLEMLEGSSIQNLTLASGTSSPSNPSVGELFFNTTSNALTIYNGSSWVAAGSGGGGGAVDSVAGKTGVVTLVAADVSGVVATSTKGVANGVASLDSTSKIPTAQLPALAITDVFSVSTEAAMLALSAERGDVVIRTDLNKTFILSADTPTVLAAWLEVLSPTGAVSSVNSMTGAVSISTITGNAGSATVLQTARNITLAGAVTGTASFNGSTDATITTSLAGDTVVSKTFNGAVSVNYSTEGSYVIGNVTGAATLTITGVPDSTRAFGMVFELTNAGANITWPASVSWLGNAPTLRSSGVSMVTLVTRNGGTTWYGSAA